MMGQVQVHSLILGFYTSQDSKHVWGTLCGRQPKKSKIAFSDRAYGNGHPTFYEGDHGNDYSPCSPITNPFPLGSVSHTHSWWNPIFCPEASHTLLGFNQILEFTHSPKGFWRKVNKFKIEVKKRF